MAFPNLECDLSVTSDTTSSMARVRLVPILYFHACLSSSREYGPIIACEIKLCVMVGNVCGIYWRKTIEHFVFRNEATTENHNNLCVNKSNRQNNDLGC
jgi:hypothetical protein